ncbi:MAG TPA: ABC transporter substrate-binding protein [Thermomicrobiales bacterium]|nr:ABC transporter substrate-binding protein [Thermomicrobiales bacterium]
MAQQSWADTIRAIEGRRLHRRRLLQTGAVAAAAALPVVRDRVIPVGVSAQSDPRQLVVLDNIQGGNWLYLDPGKIYEINPQSAMQLVYECLYHLPSGENIGQVEPLLAQDFPIYSEDGLTATITLKPGVRFHGSGNEMTADDWLWSWNRLKNVLGNPSFLYTDFIESVSAPDPETLEIKLLAANAALPAILTSTPFSVVDSRVAQENGGVAEEGADATDTLTDWLNQGNSIGTGPYTLAQWDIANEIIIEANADYWGDAPGFDRIIFRNVEDTNTQLQLIETGEADIAFAIDPDRVSQVESNPGLQIIEGPSLAHEDLAMHTGEEVGGPLAVKEARQAVAHAVDYAGIIDGLMGGRAVRPATPVTLGLLGADEVADLAYQTDVARANELWAASGNGPSELTLTWGAGQTAPGGLNRDILAAKLQDDIQRIEGVTVVLSPMDPTQRLQEYREAKLQFTMSDWTPDYADVHSYADPFGGSAGAASKRVAFSNEEIDMLLQEGIGERDEAARLEDYVRIQEIMVDEVAFLVEFQPNYLMPAAASVRGAQPHGTYILQLRYATKEA